MTTHYEALVRDVADLKPIYDKIVEDNDWSAPAMRACRRYFACSTVLRHSTNAITPEWVVELRDSWRNVMRGSVGHCLYVDVTRCQFKRRPSLMLVHWRVRQEGEPEGFPQGEAIGHWSIAIMSVPDFHAFLGAFYLEDSDV